KRQGKTLKGPVLVSRWQFNHFKQSDGIGFRTEEPPAWQEKVFRWNWDRRRVRIRAQEECGHFLLMGDTGTGKSVLIQQLLDQVRARGEAAIIYDSALEFVPRYYDPSPVDGILIPSMFALPTVVPPKRSSVPASPSPFASP